MRIRSLIERTRIIAVEAAATGSASGDVQDELESSTETNYEESARIEGRKAKDLLNMNISKMYEQSLGILGDSLG